MRILSGLKNRLVPPEREARRIVSGPFRDIVMNLSLRSETQVYLGLFEREIHRWLLRLSQDIVTAIDIGAAHGEYTLFFLLKTRAKRIHTFEPDLTRLPSFYRNLELNEIPSSGRLEVSTKLVGLSNSEQETQLDSLAETIHTPLLIKMDVDGAEEQILKGATKINARSRVRWLIETHSQELEVACMELLKRAGFETTIIPNAWWRVLVPEFRPIKHNRWLAAWKNTPSGSGEVGSGVLSC
jgi:FkbM family methyltransferase